MKDEFGSDKRQMPTAINFSCRFLLLVSFLWNLKTQHLPFNLCSFVFSLLTSISFYFLYLIFPLGLIFFKILFKFTSTISLFSSNSLSIFLEVIMDGKGNRCCIFWHEIVLFCLEIHNEKEKSCWNIHEMLCQLLYLHLKVVSSKDIALPSSDCLFNFYPTHDWISLELS